MARDMFLKIDGIEGESEDSVHKGEIDVLSWSWGMSQSGSAHEGKGGTSGKVNVQDITFTKHLDKSSTVLMSRCCDGTHIKNAVLTMRKQSGDTPVEYLKIEFTDLIVSSYQTSGSGDEIPFETISFNFGKHNVTYKPQSNEGSEEGAVEHGWDIRENKAAA